MTDNQEPDFSGLELGEFKSHVYYQETQSQIHIVLKDRSHNGIWTKDFETIMEGEEIVGFLIYTGGFKFVFGDTVEDFLRRIAIYDHHLRNIPAEPWESCKKFRLVPMERF